MNHNLKIKPRDTDWIFGSTSKITFKAVGNGVWTPWFNEDQRNPNFDDDGCACYLGNKNTDAQIDLLLTGHSDLIAKLTTLGFMDLGLDQRMHFHSSPRFTEIMTGNGTKGNSMPEVFDTIRAYGLVPWTSAPFTQAMTQEEYFNPANLAQLKALGQQFLSIVGGKNFLQYHWVENDGVKNPAQWQSLMLQAPLGFGIAVNDAGWNQVVPVDPPANQTVQHAVMCYQITAPNCSISDNYPPYDKELDTGYPIPFCIQAVVTLPIVVEQQVVSEVAAIVPEVVNAPIPTAQKETLLEEIIDVIQEVGTEIL